MGNAPKTKVVKTMIIVLEILIFFYAAIKLLKYQVALSQR